LLRAKSLTRFGDVDVVAAHLPLAHLSVLSKGPVFKAVAAFPLHPIMRVLELVPKLDSNFVR
jgi:hypothetical protein